MKLSVFCASLCRNYRFASSRLLYQKKILHCSYNRVLVHPFNQCFVFSFGASSILWASFHTTHRLCAKQFQERENEYAHNVMSIIDSYNESIVSHPLTMKSGSDTTSCPEKSTFKELSEFAEVTQNAVLHSLCLEDVNCSELIESLVLILPNVSDDQLIQIIHCLCLWQPSPKSWSPNFKALWNALDFECVHRIKSWDIQHKLLVADYWFHLRLNRISQYNKNLIQDLLENLSLLSNSQVVQLMFYINLHRKVPQNWMPNLEERLASVLKAVSIEEVGIVCLGFFKTESRITNFNTIQLIINRFCKEIASINTLTVVAILKFLKKSLHLGYVESYVPLLHKCVSHISNWDIPTSIHSALLASECHVFHPLLLGTVTEKVANGIENARIKDCTKLLQCLSHFNHYPESIFHELFYAELTKKYRQKEIEKHPRLLVYSVLYYAYLGKYDLDLVSTVLDPKFRNDCKLKFPETVNTFAEIDYCIEIDCQDYTGPRLGREELKVLGDRRGNFLNNPRYQNMFTRLLNEVSDCLEELLNGKENILVRHILPHMFSPDIIVRLTEGPEPLFTLYKKFPPDSVLIPPKGEIWACFVISPSFSFAFKSRHLTGNTGMKMRQLEKIGYKVVSSPFYDIPKSRLLRKRYLREKLDFLRTNCIR